MQRRTFVTFVAVTVALAFASSEATLQQFPSLKEKANAKQALQVSDYGLVLEQGQTRIEDEAPNILGDRRIANLSAAACSKSGRRNERT